MTVYPDHRLLSRGPVMSRVKKPQDLSARTANSNWRHVSVYLPPELFGKIQEKATAARRSLSAEITVLLEGALGRSK